MQPYRRILCAVDFSEASIAALRHADELASTFGATLTALHIVPDPLQQPWTAEAYGLDIGELQARWIEQARTQLSRLTGACKSNPATLCRVGRPAPAILEFARTEAIDLIVLGSHGHGALAQVILGSVADRVVRQAPCPVLMVRPTPAGASDTVATDSTAAAFEATAQLPA